MILGNIEFATGPLRLAPRRRGRVPSGFAGAPPMAGGGMGTYFEELRAVEGEYPAEWPAVAWLVKTSAGWRCERCEHEHDPIVGRTLTVHHLDGQKWNLQHWNLSALCQRCHLRVQHRVTFYQDWPLEHRPWMARHVQDYNEWAARNGAPQLSLVGVETRDYSGEWPAAEPVQAPADAGHRQEQMPIDV